MFHRPSSEQATRSNAFIALYSFSVSRLSSKSPPSQWMGQSWLTQVLQTPTAMPHLLGLIDRRWLSYTLSGFHSLQPRRPDRRTVPDKTRVRTVNALHVSARDWVHRLQTPPGHFRPNQPICHLLDVWGVQYCVNTIDVTECCNQVPVESAIRPRQHLC